MAWIDDAASWPLPQVSTKYVIEAANGPTTPEGDQVLRARGITVLPDIYTNGGASFTPCHLASECRPCWVTCSTSCPAVALHRELGMSSIHPPKLEATLQTVCFCA